MSVLSKDQRSLVQVDTHIDPFIVDRVCDAFDALLRGDREGYMRNMSIAVAQLGMPVPIPASERPTAVDRMKFIVIGVIARQWRCNYGMAIDLLKVMVDG